MKTKGLCAPSATYQTAPRTVYYRTQWLYSTPGNLSECLSWSGVSGLAPNGESASKYWLNDASGIYTITATLGSRCLTKLQDRLDGLREAFDEEPADKHPGNSDGYYPLLADDTDHDKLDNPYVAVGAKLQLPLYKGPSRTVSWASSTPSVATGDGSGKVKGIATGTAQITVTDNENDHDEILIYVP